MRSLNTQGAANTAEDLHEKEGQQMACFGTPEINSAAAEILKMGLNLPLDDPMTSTTSRH